MPGDPVDTWDKFDIAIGTRPNREVVDDVPARRPSTQTAMLRPDAQGKPYEVGDIGVMPNVQPHLASLVKGDVPRKRGLKPGDIVLAVDGAADGAARRSCTDAISQERRTAD